MDIDNPAAPAKFNSKKILVPAGIVIILAILFAVGFWYFTSNPQTTNSIPKVEKVTPVASPSATVSAPKDLTEDWLTYTNKEVGYEIKYPNNWLVNSPTCEPDFASVAPTKDLLGICDSGKVGIIGFYRTVSGDTIDKISSQYTESYYTNLIKTNLISPKKGLKITGILSKDPIYNPSRKGSSIIIYLYDLSDKTLILKYFQLPTEPDYSKEFEQMVSTFKFL